jgi:hypothetical protein
MKHCRGFFKEKHETRSKRQGLSVSDEGQERDGQANVNHKSESIKQNPLPN